MYTQTPKTASTSLLGLAFCFNLCACSTTSETFDCPAGKGVGCKSISAVNHMVNQEDQLHAPLGSLEERGVQFITPLSAPVISVSSPGVEAASDHAETPLSHTMAIHRIQEEHLRVWIAPYQDTHGNLHEGSIVHTVLKPGSWQVRVTDSRVSDPKIVDQRIVDQSVSDTNIDDPGVGDPHSSNLEEYP
jgi:conjugal transfer pilus assembly protein TraV